MPILEPSLQSLLLNSLTEKNSKHPNRFYLRYLRVASHNIYRNYATVGASIQFKKDLQRSIDLIQHKFGVQLYQSDFNDPNITDYYKYFFNKINFGVNFENDKSKRLIGNYYKLDNQFSTQLFQPTLHLSKNHSWFFLDTPVAILTINLQNKMKDKPYFYQLIKLEVDLMVAAGFSLVLCANYNLNGQNFLFELIESNQFSEIHLNFASENIEQFIIHSDRVGHSYFKTFKGYFYCYSQYINQISNCIEIFKEFRKMPHIKTITFAKNVFDSLIKYNYINTEPFAYCKNGFDKRHLRIFLSNIPLYDYDDDSQSFVPSQTSGQSICYIKPCDFLNWKEKRIEVIFDDMKNNRRYKKYANFEDIHKIKKDFYVCDSLSTKNILPETIEKIDEIERRINEILEKRKNQKFKKSFFFSFIKDKLIQNTLEYATYAYTFSSNSLENEFSIHRPQIYTILEACNILLKKSPTKKLKELIKRKNKIDSILSFDTKRFLESRKFFSDEQNKKFQAIRDTIQKSKHFPPQVKEFLSIYLFNKPGNYLNDITDLDVDDIIKEIILGKVGKEKNKLLIEKREIEKQIIQCQREVSNGVVYQVETGEGKSCIVNIIAAILALNGKTVHITSSNIQLANRDYRNSFDFFRLLNLKSAVFLHQNELPVPVIKKEKNGKNNPEGSIDNNDNNNIKEIKKNSNKENESENDPFFKDNMDKYYKEYTKSDKTMFSRFYNDTGFDYYDFEQFQNSSKMNFAVCGLDNDNKVPPNRPNIVFSTFVNFECFYLKMMELSPGMIDSYFNDCTLLIDEADSVLIDEIGNGTII